ncbi:hypothetical protein HEP84_55350 [Streptomyces sp. RLB1-33]
MIYGRGGNDLLFGENIDQSTQSVPGVGGVDSFDGGAGDDILRGDPTPISSTATPARTTAPARKRPTSRSAARSDRPGSDGRTVRPARGRPARDTACAVQAVTSWYWPR